MLTKEQVEYLLPYAYNAALRAGARILEIYDRVDSYDIGVKPDQSPITEADRKAHNTIKKHLATTRVPLLSEEGRELLWEERRGWDLYWMVDPLDGTREFIKGNGEFTVNIALMADNRPVMSVVYVPYTGRIYFGESNTGAFVRTGVFPNAEADLTFDQIMDGATKLERPGKMNEPIRIAVSRSHNNDETYRWIDIIKGVYPDAEVVEHGSSYKFCLLAEGIVDIYIRTTKTYEWDTAAGQLILEMTGGAIMSLPGREPLEYNEMSLTNPNFICRSGAVAEIPGEYHL